MEKKGYGNVSTRHHATSAPAQQATTAPAKNNKQQKGYKKLFVWQKANELAYQIYQSTKSFPQEERYGMTSQLRRSALSVPTNIVEGYGRQGNKELKHFLNIALGSLAETEYLLDFCLRLKYFSSHDHQKLQDLRQEVGNLLWKFYKSI